MTQHVEDYLDELFVYTTSQNSLSTSESTRISEDLTTYIVKDLPENEYGLI